MTVDSITIDAIEEDVAWEEHNFIYLFRLADRQYIANYGFSENCGEKFTGKREFQVFQIPLVQNMPVICERVIDEVTLQYISYAYDVRIGYRNLTEFPKIQMELFPKLLSGNLPKQLSLFPF